MADKIVVEAEVKSNIGEVSKDASSLAGEFKIMGVSLNSVKAGFVSIGKTAKASFATIRAGIMSTGIGALVLAVGALASFFTNTKRGADQLTQAFTAMGAVVDVLKDRLSKVGEALSFVFSGEFKKAGEALKGTFSGIADEVEREVAAMVALKKRTQELRDADMEFMVQKAKTRQEIEKARLIAEDETKSAKERLENLKKALELEAETTQAELVLARERMKIQEEEMALSENSAEDEERLAQLKTEIIEKETASIKMRRRVVTEVNSLEREIHAEAMARLKERKEADAEIMGQLTEMPRLATEVNDQLIQADADYTNIIMGNAKKRTNFIKQQQDAQLAATASFAGALSSLAGENKQLAAAEALINTYLAVQQTMADKTIPSTAIKFLTAGTVLASGLANVRRIFSTPVPGAGGGGGGVVADTQTPAPQMMSGAFELTGGQAPEPLRAYVLTDEMTNSQNQLANIRRRATI
jgi:hypothetical protein